MSLKAAFGWMKLCSLFIEQLWVSYTAMTNFMQQVELANWNWRRCQAISSSWTNKHFTDSFETWPLNDEPVLRNDPELPSNICKSWHQILWNTQFCEIYTGVANLVCWRPSGGKYRVTEKRRETPHTVENTYYYGKHDFSLTQRRSKISIKW